jgi:hypothetical protein
MKVRKEIAELIQKGVLSPMNEAPFASVLGEQMPKLERTRIGRTRLMSALQKRFGEDFRGVKAAQDLLQKFDDEVEFAKTALTHRGVIRGK